MFNQYPYLNLNDLNLDYILKAIKEMRYEVTNFVSINAIKYADPIQWNITKQYEKNTIVIDPVTGTAYISVAPVPAGVALTRPEYWTVVFDLGSFVTRAAQNFTSRWESDTTTTATFSTPAGAWLVWGDVLYKALSNIIAGDTYVVGSNIEHFTIEDLYNAYLNTIASILAMIGDLVNLTTADKDNIVDAINEVNGIANDNAAKIDNMKIANVRDFGAVGDGTTDDTNAIQSCLDAAETDGARVYLPVGNYKITSITIPRGVEVSGVVSRSGYGNHGGTFFYCVDSSLPAIQINDGATLSSVGFYYPEQALVNNIPKSYPATLALTDGNTGEGAEGGNQPKRITLDMLYFVNPYIAIDFSKKHDLAIIQNITGYAIYKGLIDDDSRDTDRVHNVHFNWNAYANAGLPDMMIYKRWTRDNGISFEIGRVDWLTLDNIFSWGYLTGLYIHQMSTGNIPEAVRVLNSGFDSCSRCVIVAGDRINTDAILFEGCMFMSNAALNTGAITEDYAILVDRCKNVQFIGCLFGNSLHGSILLTNNVMASVVGCTFNNVRLEATPGYIIAVGSDTNDNKTIISDNQFEGKNLTQCAGVSYSGVGATICNNTFMDMANTGVFIAANSSDINIFNNVYNTSNSSSALVLESNITGYCVENPNDKAIITDSGSFKGNYVDVDDYVTATDMILKANSAPSRNNSMYMTPTGALTFRDYNAHEQIVARAEGGVYVNTKYGSPVNTIYNSSDILHYIDPSANDHELKYNEDETGDVRYSNGQLEYYDGTNWTVVPSP